MKIVIFCAMYWEGAFIIDEYKLKKNTDDFTFQTFVNSDENIYLVITGTGMINAATAVGTFAGKYGLTSEDYVLNIGSCGAMGNINKGEVYICNKVRNVSQERDFYPDILYRHGFNEGRILCVTKVYDGSNSHIFEGEEGDFLYDMESAGIYESCNKFIGPHQILIIKLVTDFGGDSKNVTPKTIDDAFRSCKDGIFSQINTLIKIQFEDKSQKLLSHNGQVLYHDMVTSLCCSKTMELELKQIVRYTELSKRQGELEKIIDEMRVDGILPCKSKREGKKCFEEIKNRLF